MSYIGKARSVPYGANVLAYIMGESPNKKHREKIIHIASYHLHPNLTPGAVWQLMLCKQQMRRAFKNTLIRGELCPDPAMFAKKTQGMTRYELTQYLRNLWEEYRDILDKGDDKSSWNPLGLKDCQTVLYLHLDSKSGNPHLHFAVNMVDVNGNRISDHQLPWRARYAADALARKHGLMTAWEKGKTNSESKRRALANDPTKQSFTQDCYEALKSFTSFSLDKDFDLYIAALRDKGYDVLVHKDKYGKPAGYSLTKDGVTIRASALGTGRNLLFKNLEKTHDMLQNMAVFSQVHTGATATSNAREAVKHVAISRSTASNDTNEANEPTEWRRHLEPVKTTDVMWIVNLHHKEQDEEKIETWIPKKFDEKLDRAFPAEECENNKELCNTAILSFIGAIVMAPLAAAGTPSGGGGGDSSNLPWRNRDDEDWMNRCINHAIACHGINHTNRKYKLKR